MGEATTQDKPGSTVAVAGGGGGTPATVSPTDAQLAKDRAERDAWEQDHIDHPVIGPLDSVRPKGSMSDPDGHCVRCGKRIEPGAFECDECNMNVSDFDKEINDFWWQHHNESNAQIQDAWNKGPQHQEYLQNKQATKSQTNV
jgi:hypothetical protein